MDIFITKTLLILTCVNVGLVNAFENEDTVVDGTYLLLQQMGEIKDEITTDIEGNQQIKVHMASLLESLSSIVGKFEELNVTEKIERPLCASDQERRILERNELILNMKELSHLLKMVLSNKTSTLGGPYGDLSVAESSCSVVKRDCLELYESGCKTDGVYLIDPLQRGRLMKVYCDMTQNGGGWTVIQRRVDNSVNFYRNWDSYCQGFGLLTGNMWLGLDSIYHLTHLNSGDITEIHINLKSFDGETRFAKYSQFFIDDYMDFYRLHISGYYGTAGDSMSGRHNNNRFSAYDVDVDTYSGNCAVNYRGAWWYSACHSSNLNGLYQAAGVSDNKGIRWSGFKGSDTLKKAIMKIRRHPSK